MQKLATVCLRAPLPFLEVPAGLVSVTIALCVLVCEVAIFEGGIHLHSRDCCIVASNSVESTATLYVLKCSSGKLFRFVPNTTIMAHT